MADREKRSYTVEKSFTTISLFFVVFLFSVGFVSAAVTINQPASAGAYSATTGDGDNENITVSVTFTPGIAGENATNVTYYYRESSSHNWNLIGTNATQNVTSYPFVWNISNLPDGTTYEFNATVHNATETLDGATVTSVIIDNTPSKVTMDALDGIQKKSGTTFEYGDAVIIRCTREDAASGFNYTNITVQVPGSTSYEQIGDTSEAGTASGDFDVTFKNTKNLGSYALRCFVMDKAGNINSSANGSFDILSKPPSGGSPFADPSFKPPVAVTIVGAGAVSDLGALTEVGVSRLIANTGSVVMTVDGGEHTFAVTDIVDESSVTFRIDNSFDLTVNSGETKTVDVTADGADDVSIELHQIFKRKADTTFKLLSVQAAPPTTEPETTPEPTVTSTITEEQGSWLVIVLVIVAVILIIFVVLHFVAGRERGGPQGKSPVAFNKKDLGAYRQQGAAAMRTRNTSGNAGGYRQY